MSGRFRGIILDYTGVITVALPGSATDPAPPPPRPTERATSFDPTIMRALMANEIRNDDPDGMWNRLERGEISIDVMADFAETQMAGAGDFMRNVVGAVMSRLDIRPDVAAAVKRWKQAGYRTAVLTNNVAEWRPLWQAKLRDADMLHLFDAIVDSSEVGMRKPEARIYLHTATVLGLSPEECVFVDDFAHNVEGASATGMHAVLATAEDLHLDLVDGLLG